MTVTSEVNNVTYAGDGVTTEFPWPNTLITEAAILVATVDNVTLEITPLILDTDYEVDILPDFSAATVTTTVPVAGPSIDSLVIIRNEPQTQTVDYIEGGPFEAKVNEQGLDLLTMQNQTDRAGLLTTLRIPLELISFVDTNLPTPVGGTVWFWNAEGTAVEFREPTDPTQSIRLPNNFGYFIEDNGGTSQSMVFFDSSNVVQLGETGFVNNIPGLTNFGSEVNFPTKWNLAEGYTNPSKVDGDMWYDDTANRFLVHEGGVDRAITDVGGGGPGTPGGPVGSVQFNAGAGNFDGDVGFSLETVPFTQLRLDVPLIFYDSSAFIGRNVNTSFLRLEGGDSIDEGATMLLYGSAGPVPNSGVFSVGGVNSVVWDDTRVAVPLGTVASSKTTGALQVLGGISTGGNIFGNNLVIDKVGGGSLITLRNDPLDTEALNINYLGTTSEWVTGISGDNWRVVVPGESNPKLQVQQGGDVLMGNENSQAFLRIGQQSNQIGTPPGGVQGISIGTSQTDARRTMDTFSTENAQAVGWSTGVYQVLTSGNSPSEPGFQNYRANGTPSGWVGSRTWFDGNANNFAWDVGNVNADGVGLGDPVVWFNGMNMDFGNARLHIKFNTVASQTTGALLVDGGVRVGINLDVATSGSFFTDNTTAPKTYLQLGNPNQKSAMQIVQADTALRFTFNPGDGAGGFNAALGFGFRADGLITDRWYAGGNFSIEGGASSNRSLWFMSSQIPRWHILCTSDPEGGGNSGSDFSIQNRNDAGALINTPIHITRSTGLVTFNTPVIFNDTVNIGNVEFTDVNINGPNMTERILRYRTSDFNRWTIIADATDETGTQVGSDLKITRFSDAGAPLGNPFTITRANGFCTFENTMKALSTVDISGLLTLSNGLFVTGTTNVAALNAANTGITGTLAVTAHSNIATLNCNGLSTLVATDILGTLDVTGELALSPTTTFRTGLTTIHPTGTATAAGTDPSLTITTTGPTNFVVVDSSWASNAQLLDLGVVPENGQVIILLNNSGNAVAVNTGGVQAGTSYPFLYASTMSGARAAQFIFFNNIWREIKTPTI